MRTTITLSEFRNNLPMILAKVALLGEEFVVTKHGKPVAVLMPSRPEINKSKKRKP